jgi:hypothetical protein
MLEDSFPSRTLLVVFSGLVIAKMNALVTDESYDHHHCIPHQNKWRANYPASDGEKTMQISALRKLGGEDNFFAQKT